MYSQVTVTLIFAVCQITLAVFCSGRISCNLLPIDFGGIAPDVGFLKQSSDDEKDWKVINGNTPSGNTGPSSDHTTGSGYYAYLEASGIAKGSRVCVYFCLIGLCDG